MRYFPAFAVFFFAVVASAAPFANLHDNVERSDVTGASFARDNEISKRTFDIGLKRVSSEEVVKRFEFNSDHFSSGDGKRSEFSSDAFQNGDGKRSDFSTDEFKSGGGKRETSGDRTA